MVGGVVRGLRGDEGRDACEVGANGASGALDSVSELSQELWLRAAGAGTSWSGYFVNLSDLVPELSRVGRLIPSGTVAWPVMKITESSGSMASARSITEKPLAPGICTSVSSTCGPNGDIRASAPSAVVAVSTVKPAGVMMAPSSEQTSGSSSTISTRGRSPEAKGATRPTAPSGLNTPSRRAPRSSRSCEGVLRNNRRVALRPNPRFAHPLLGCRQVVGPANPLRRMRRRSPRAASDRRPSERRRAFRQRRSRRTVRLGEPTVSTWRSRARTASPAARARLAGAGSPMRTQPSGAEHVWEHAVEADGQP